MRIELGLLSILATALLAFFIFQGGDVELYSWEVGFSVSSDEVRVTIDPVFAIWIPQSLLRTIGYNAFAYGNIMVLNKQQRGTSHGDWSLAHESNHIEQCFALGWFMWPARFFIDVEPPKTITPNWSDLLQPDRTMWLPPPFWVDQWHFFSFLVDIGQQH